MTLRLACALAVALGCGAGCRQVFGFEDPLVDEGPDFEVTGTHQQHVGRNNALLEHEVTRRVAPVDELEPSVQLSDGSSQPVDYFDDGTFSFARNTPDELYRLTIGGVEYQHTAANLVVDEYIPGRLDATPVTLPTLLEFRFTTAILGTPLITSSGVFGVANPQVPANSTAFDVDWSTVFQLPRFGLLDAAANDRLYVAFLEITPSPQQYLVATSLATFAVTQLDGVTTRLTSPPTPVTRSYCVRMQARRIRALDRLRAALPQFGSFSADFRITQVPGFEHREVPHHVVVIDGTTGSDANVDVRYGTPFPAGRVHTGVAVFGRRDVAIPGVTQPLKLSIVGVQTSPLAPTVGCEPAIPTFDIGIPGALSLAGIPLTVDNVVLGVPNEDLEVTWMLTAPGPVDFTEVLLVEVDLSQPTPALHTRAVRRIRTVTQSAWIPRDVFVPGQRYVILVRTITGNPRAAEGNFATFQYPAAYMQTMSSPFQVDG
ncbi:MAG: hypothetical protein H0T42_04235 [Deltaproteobacteria bacterium]|nr:hypothetical protein [Deltaproteobacteria bacterium]